MGGTPLFAEDFSPTCYWHDRTPPPDLAEAALPATAEAIVIGAGYTGLHAALVLARAGRSTVVIDAEAAGWGCSTRNGGQVASGIKPGFAELVSRFGEPRARAIFAEGRRALDGLAAFIEAEGIDCDFRRSGRFHGAHSPAAYRKMAATVERLPADLRQDVMLVPAGRQAAEIATDVYHGGIVQLRNAALDPARYHRGLLGRVRAAGAAIVPHCRATALRREGGCVEVATSRGVIAARDVIVATNGYTGELVSWLRRRIIPIGSYIIATEPLDQALTARLFPSGRVVTDSRKVVYYYRVSPDGTRILFGGRVSAAETDPRKSAAPLKAEMARLFPELANVRVSRSWMGFVAYTFDTFPHLGSRDGIHYAMGYCGSGVAMAGHLGGSLAARLLGRDEGLTAFDDMPFPSRPYYFGRPWFLSAAIAYYRWRDRREAGGR
jgi:glycine/D-amino acid oxidase-like deaminating enzyme